MAASPVPFRFQDIHSFAEMQAFITKSFPTGTPRETLRQIFVDEGGATLKIHPQAPGVEKYIYDINLCRYYIWRWNISADYDTAGKLTALYLNGLKDGVVQKMATTPPPGSKPVIAKAQRPRPEADKGEKSLGYLVLDLDGNLATLADQKVIGGGPSQLDPANLGRMVIYADVDAWRSIFDSDAAASIAPYDGDCSKADAAMQEAAKRQGVK